MDGKSMALQFGRARDASLCAFLVFSTTFFGINRPLASQRMGSLIRPLLFISRNDVKKLCRFWGLPIYPDVTNQTVVFSRNRIRKQLLPALRVALNPQVDSVLSQSAEIMFAERLQQDLLALKLLRAYQYVPRLECGCPKEEEGKQTKWRPRVMERQLSQRSTGTLVGHMKLRLGWDGLTGLTGLTGEGGGTSPPRRSVGRVWLWGPWGQGPLCKAMPPTAERVRWPLPNIEGDGVLHSVEQNAKPPGGLRGSRVLWSGEETPQPLGGPTRPLTSVDMSVVGGTRVDYSGTLAVKSRDLQAVWLGFGKTGAILDAKDPCHHQKQCIRLLHKRRGCLFLPQVGIFFTNSISPLAGRGLDGHPWPRKASKASQASQGFGVPSDGFGVPLDGLWGPWG